MEKIDYLLEKFSLKGNVILVTGGYGLLGKEFARIIHKAGGTVVIAGRDIKKAKEAANAYKGMAVEMDVTNKDSINSAVDLVIEKYGKIDGLVNNASYSAPADEKGQNFVPFEEISRETWNQSLGVDLTGTFFCCQSVGKAMSQHRGGVIVNVSSIYGSISPDPHIYQGIVNSEGKIFNKPPGYCTAKGGVLSLTRYLAVYWRKKNIRVNSLTLGGVHDNQNKSFVAEYSQKVPLGRMADKEEYNGAILFLLSAASSYMTGSNLVIDGGITAW